ncbi:unnamed protein product [Clonostachys rhizophaga]|uniref:Uncharacterized protein n=1 Tax=Clonostachys rhizophaga TaxID=160324 RepID=A0A9N9VXB5_9HYPO|nr:unnamed protein product [Clonostachys rhizophaga]
MSHNIIVMQYCRAAVAGILRWMTSCAILGMTASCLAHEATPKEARAAIILNLVCACLHIPLLGPFPLPVSETKLRPRPWYAAVLAVSTLMWPAAAGILFANLFSLGREKSPIDTRLRVCAALDIANIALCALQWTMIFKVKKTERFGERYRAIGYQQVQELFEFRVIHRNLLGYFIVVQQVD